MKKILVILLMFPLIIRAQTDSIISYKGVVSVDNEPKLQLFSKARNWCDSIITDFKNNNTISDNETGELGGPASMMFDINAQARKNIPISVLLEYKVKLTVKDGKYKYEFSEFNVRGLSESIVRHGLLRSSKDEDWYASKKFSETVYNETKEGVDSEVKKLIVSLRRTMEANNDF